MRTRELAMNLALVTSTTARELRVDPLQFLLQTSRRLPRSVPARLGKVLSIGRPGAVRAAYGAWIADRPDWARNTLAAAPAKRQGRLFGELANQLDVPELIPEPELRGRLAVRVAVRRGDVVDTSPEFASAKEPSASVGRSAKEPLSVFHLLTNSVPHTGSGYAYRSHAVLKAQRDAGLRVAAATRLGYPVIVGKVRASHHDVIDGIDYHRLMTPRVGQTLPERTRQAADLLEPLVRSFGADVLCTTTDYTNALVAQEVAARLGVPWTYEVRGLPEDTWVANQPTRPARAQALKSTRYSTLQAREAAAARAADRVFTLGAALRDDFVARGVTESKVTVVHNAADPLPESARIAPKEARRRLGLPTAGVWVGSVTSLVAYEGIDVLLKAVALARSEGIDLCALIVGDGVARPTLESEANRLGLELGTEVVFTGRVPQVDARLHCQALDIFAVPRRDERVSRLVPPLKPLDAMAVGRPIVSSDLPALRELVNSADCGVLVAADHAKSWADTLVGLVADRKTQEIYSRRGRRTHVKQQSWPTEGVTYGGALRSVLALGLCSV